MTQASIPHDFPFDPRYGHDETMLRHIRAPDTAPEDFVLFWRNLHTGALQVPLNLRVEKMDCPWHGLRLEKCSYTVWPDYRVGAWLLRPDHGRRPELGVVLGHGYGGREEPEPGRCGPDRATLFPVAPGFHLSPSAISMPPTACDTSASPPRSAARFSIPPCRRPASGPPPTPTPGPKSSVPSPWATSLPATPVRTSPKWNTNGRCPNFSAFRASHKCGRRPELQVQKTAPWVASRPQFE